MDHLTSDEAIPGPSQWGWFSFSLGEYRPCPEWFYTYWGFPYDSLPPISGVTFTGDFQWLTPLEGDLGGLGRRYRPSSEERAEITARVGAIEAQARYLGLTLPPGFLRFMASPELQDRIPSCTDCTFWLPDRIVPYPGRDNGYVIAFLSDSQACGIWHLYLTTDGAHRVLEAPLEFVELTTQAAQCSAATLDDILAHVYLCGPTFEEFLYRFWLENMLWYHLTDDSTVGAQTKPRPYTEAQQQYLAHYATK